MEHFAKAQTVRLRSHHKAYLSTPDDDGGGDSSAAKQIKNGASHSVQWLVEPVPLDNDRIRLRSPDGRYLSASDKRFLLGATGRKVLLLPRPDPSTEWRPVKEGNHVKLQSRQGTFLRGNGGIMPYKGSVTHDVPSMTATQEWVLWEVEVLQVRPSLLQPRQQPSPPPPREYSKPDLLVSSGRQSESLGDSEWASRKESVSGSQSESGSSSGFPVPTQKHGFSMSEGRTIQYYMLDANGKVDEFSRGAFTFHGSSVEELTSIVEEMTGLQDVILYTHDVINDRLLRLQLTLPPNRRTMTVVVVPSSSAEKIMNVDPSVGNESNNLEDVQKNFKKQKKLRSEVWNHYDRIYKKEKMNVKDDEIEVDVLWAKCKHCFEEFRHGTDAEIIHLSDHYKRSCPKISKLEPGQLLMQSSTKVDESSTLMNYTFDDEHSQLLLARAIMVHGYPFNIVSHVAFRAYIHSLRPQHKIPSRTTMEKLCKVTYIDEKKKIYQNFENLSSRISLTMDKWTTSSQNKSYLCITAHFIDDSWKLQKKIINFINADVSTGVHISSHFLSRMFEWNIDKKLFTVTMDNDKANDEAICHIKTRLSDSLPCNGLFFHVRCAAHAINLVVQDGLKVISSAIQRVRLGIKYVTCSPQMEAMFNETTQQVDPQLKKSLALDCCTRWNSTYLMLTTALEYKDVFKRFAFRDSNFVHALSDDEWEYVRKLEECLKHFYDVTELLSGSNYVTSNLFFVEFCEIQLLFVEWLKSNDKIIISMATVMKLKFDRYWDMCSQLLAVASILDPRYKMKAIEIYYTDLYPNDADKKVIELRSIVKKLFQSYSSLVKDHRTGSSDVIVSLPPSNPSEKRKSRFAQIMDKEDVEPSKSELDEYLEEKCLKWKDDCGSGFDILGWWKQNIGRFPILGKMAKDILGVPVSTVAFESAFSDGGRVVDTYRSNLGTEMVEVLICGQDWLKDEFKVETDSLFEQEVVEDISNMQKNSIETNESAAQEVNNENDEYGEYENVEKEGYETNKTEDEFW